MNATATVTVTASGLYLATVTAGAACARSIGGRPASAIKGAVDDLAIDGFRVVRVKVTQANLTEDDDAPLAGRVFSPAVSGGWTGYTYA